jgi:hypothetical protein
MSNTTIDLTPRLPGVTRPRGERSFGQKIGLKRVTAKEVLLVAGAVMFGLGFLMGPGWFVLAFFAAIWSVVLSRPNFEWAAPCPHEVKRLFNEPPEDPFDKFRPGTYKYELYFGSAGFEDDEC